jgi:hypothetical protein
MKPAQIHALANGTETPAEQAARIGIYPEADLEPDARRARATAAVQSVLADLDRHWKVPPSEFCAELAVQIVDELHRSPALLAPIALHWHRMQKGLCLIDELAREGVCVRLEKGRLVAGPADRVTKDVVEKIAAGKALLLAALGG